MSSKKCSCCLKKWAISYSVPPLCTICVDKQTSDALQNSLPVQPNTQQSRSIRSIGSVIPSVAGGSTSTVAVAPVNAPLEPTVPAATVPVAPVPQFINNVRASTWTSNETKKFFEIVGDEELAQTFKKNAVKLNKSMENTADYFCHIKEASEPIIDAELRYASKLMASHLDHIASIIRQSNLPEFVEIADTLSELPTLFMSCKIKRQRISVSLKEELERTARRYRDRLDRELSSMITNHGFPDYWQKQKDDRGVRDMEWFTNGKYLVDVDPFGTEYSDVVKSFNKDEFSDGENLFFPKIVRIRRVENRWQWIRFQMKRDMISQTTLSVPLSQHFTPHLHDHKNADNAIAWHGTGDHDPAKRALDAGSLDFRYSSKGFYGRGLYVATKSRYSAAYSTPICYNGETACEMIR